MTIIECIKDQGVLVDCDTNIHRCGSVEVFFYNPVDDVDDSTSFDIMDPLGKDGHAELHNLFREFCKENHFPSNTVIAVHLTCVAETMEELRLFC